MYLHTGSAHAKLCLQAVSHDANKAPTCLCSSYWLYRYTSRMRRRILHTRMIWRALLAEVLLVPLARKETSAASMLLLLILFRPFTTAGMSKSIDRVATKSINLQNHLGNSDSSSASVIEQGNVNS